MLPSSSSLTTSGINLVAAIYYYYYYYYYYYCRKYAQVTLYRAHQNNTAKRKAHYDNLNAYAYTKRQFPTLGRRLAPPIYAERNRSEPVQQDRNQSGLRLSSLLVPGLGSASPSGKKWYKYPAALPVFIAVFILCTSCGTKFWVMQQNRKHFPGNHLRISRRPGLLPELMLSQHCSYNLTGNTY